MFQFSFRFAFFYQLCLSNRTSKITRILTLYQANAEALMPLSKEGNILIKSLQECKVTTLSSLWQSFWIKVGRRPAKQAAGEVRNSRQASGQRQTQSAYW